MIKAQFPFLLPLSAVCCILAFAYYVFPVASSYPMPNCRGPQLNQDGIGNIVVELVTSGLKNKPHHADMEQPLVCHVRVLCERSKTPMIVIAEGEEGEFTNAGAGARFALIGAAVVTPDVFSTTTASAIQVLVYGFDYNMVVFLKTHGRQQEVLLPLLTHALPASGHLCLFFWYWWSGFRHCGCCGSRRRFPSCGQMRQGNIWLQNKRAIHATTIWQP